MNKQFQKIRVLKVFRWAFLFATLCLCAPACRQAGLWLNKKIFFILTTVFICFNANAQTTYDVFTYNEPIGYKKETKKSATTYTKIDEKTGNYCIISLFPQTQSKGDILKDFESDWAALVTKPLNVKNAPIARKSEAIGLWQTYQGAANFELNGSFSMVVLTTAKNNNFSVSIMVITNTQVFMKDVDAFFAQLKLEKLKTVAISNITKQDSIIKKPITSHSSATNFTNNGIEGVWVGYGARLLTDRAKWNFRIFFKDGLSLLGMPDNGLNNFNYKTQAGTYKSTYSYSNAKGKITYAENQFHDEIKFVDAKTLFIDGLEYRKCTSITSTKFNGTYSAYLPTDNTINTLPVGQKPRITFTANGQFNDEGLFYSYLKDYKQDDNFNAAGNGTYELKEFSIILKYDDGRVRQQSLVVPASENLSTSNMILMERGRLNKIK
jgi:hypothetical protein